MNVGARQNTRGGVANMSVRHPALELVDECLPRAPAYPGRVVLQPPLTLPSLTSTFRARLDYGIPGSDFGGTGLRLTRKYPSGGSHLLEKREPGQRVDGRRPNETETYCFRLRRRALGWHERWLFPVLSHCSPGGRHPARLQGGPGADPEELGASQRSWRCRG